MTNRLKQAKSLYGRFTGHNARNEPKKVDVPDSDVYINVGRVDAIAYTTTRDGKQEHYIHKFHASSRPQLAPSHDGKTFRAIGGRFEFTERGFVDLDKDGTPLE